jgi:small GTP-binding protein
MANPTSIEPVIQKLPPEVQDTARMVWQNLSPTEQSGFLSMLSGLPVETSLIKLLIRLSTVQLRHAFGQKSRIAIIGPANVGKSTLYNQFISQKSDLARVSPLPGTTRQNQSADAGLFHLFDTPGADAAGTTGDAEKLHAYSAARESDVILLVFDAIQGIKKSEMEIFNEVRSLGKPYLIVLNKSDLVTRDLAGIQHHAAATLGLNDQQVIPVSAKEGKHIEQLLIGIAAAEPGILTALGGAMPEYRWRLAWRSIVSAASISAVIALVPLPVLDFGPLLINQSVMVLGIARIYNYKITLSRARELMVTFGLGFLGRMLFQELSKLGGLPGWLLAAAIASSTTVAMGYAAAQWFEKGQKVSKETLNQLTREVTSRLIDAVKNLGKRKPSQEKIKQTIAESLSEFTIDKG